MRVSDAFSLGQVNALLVGAVITVVALAVHLFGWVLVAMTAVGYALKTAAAYAVLSYYDKSVEDVINWALRRGS